MTFKIDSPTALHLISLLDVTSLNATDTPEEIRLLCEKAKHPLQALNWKEFEKGMQVRYAMQISKQEIHTAAVCIYPVLVKTAKEELMKYSDVSIHLASVAGGFPSGMTPLSTRLQEIELAVEAGADEIDTVLNRSLFLQGHDGEVVHEISQMKKAARKAHFKVILETGELKTSDLISKASRLAIEGGADMIKTSTGKVTPAATLEAVDIMLNVIADQVLKTGNIVGCKAAGGIRTAGEALKYTNLARKILTEKISAEFADGYIQPKTFRFGASSLLDNLVHCIAVDLGFDLQASENNGY